MMEGPTSHGQTSGQEEGGRETSVVGLTDGVTTDFVPLILWVFHLAL